MANTATKISQTLGTVSQNLTTLGGRAYLTYNSSGNAIQKTGATGIITSASWRYDTNVAEGLGGSTGGFQNSPVTTTDGTASNITNKTTCPYTQGGFPHGRKMTVAMLAGTQTVQIAMGVYATGSNALPVEVKVYDASSTLLGTFTYTGISVNTDSDGIMEIECHADANETWTFDVKLPDATTAFTYFAHRWIHVSDVAGGGTSADLVIANCNHNNSVDSLSFSMESNLFILDNTHAFNVDSLSFSTEVTLGIFDNLHTMASDSVVLSVIDIVNLVISDILHENAVDNLTLSTDVFLVISNNQNALTSDSLSLSTDQFLDIQDCLHLTDSESLALSTNLSLIILDAISSFNSEIVSLNTADIVNLDIQDVGHLTTSDSIVISTDVFLVISEVLHGYFSENVELSTTDNQTLVISDVIHALASDNVSLTSDVYLAISDALHLHYSDLITLEYNGIRIFYGVRKGNKKVGLGRSRRQNLQTRTRH